MVVNVFSNHLLFLVKYIGTPSHLHIILGVGGKGYYFNDLFEFFIWVFYPMPYMSRTQNMGKINEKN